MMGKYIRDGVLSAEEIPNALRKLRKKLRQIEKLEQINNRLLMKEEQEKVASKDEIRQEIQRLTSELKKGENEPAEEILINLEPENTSATLNDTSLSSSTSIDDSPSCRWQEVLSGTKEIIVSTINGHNDIVYGVAADDEYIITCSRDTTAKVWSSVTGSEITSLRGHSSGVAVVLLLTHDEGNRVTEKLEVKGKHRIALTGGYDCMVCIWSVTTGELLQSVYVYNGVTSMALISSVMHLLIGTDGGKIELWDVLGLQSLDSHLTYEDCITQIQIVDNLAYIGNSESIVSVMRIVNNRIVCLYSSENVALATNGCNRIHSLQVDGDNVYYGDDGVSIKILNWRTGFIQKVRNHCMDYGSTNALILMQNEIVASSYDIDKGMGSINVFKVPENEYIGSLNDCVTGRILSIAIVKDESKFRIITVGTEVKVWDVVPSGSSTEFVTERQERIPMQRVPGYEMPVGDSDINYDDDSVSDSSDIDNLGTGRFAQLYFAHEMQARPTSFFDKWCCIL